MAKFIGRNPYTTPEDAVRLFWERNPRIADAFNVEVDTSTELTKTIRKCSSAERTALAAELGIDKDLPAEKMASEVDLQIVSKVAQTSTTLSADRIIEELPSAMVPIATTIHQEGQKMRGILREQESLSKTERETGRTVTARNDKYYESVLFFLRGFPVTLGGMVDGLFEDDGSIVEIKERRNRLFNRINAYELVQLHCYMHLTDKNKATLVERWNSETATHTTEFDAAFWSNCVASLRAFVNARLQPQSKSPPAESCPITPCFGGLDSNIEV